VGKNISSKILKNSGDVRLGAKRKCPNIVGIILKNNKLVFETKDTRIQGCP
jgi:hypothetical protein